MLHRFIHSLRTKPKAARDHIALAVAGTTTAVLAVIWLVTSSITATGADIEAASEPFGTLWGQIKAEVGQMKQDLPEASTVNEAINQLETEYASSASSTNNEAEVTEDDSLIISSSSASTSPRVVEIVTVSSSTAETD